MKTKKDYAESAYYTEQKPFPTKLRALLKERKTRQEDLARKVGVSRQQISNYARGISTPDIYQLKQIAAFFNVTIDSLLLYGDEYPYFPPFYRVDNLREAAEDRESSELYELIKSYLDLTDKGRELANEYIKALLIVPKYNLGYQESIDWKDQYEE